MSDWTINMSVRRDAAHGGIRERVLNLNLSVRHKSGREEDAGTYRIDLEEAVALGCVTKKRDGYYVRIVREDSGELRLSQRSGPPVNIARWRCD